MSIYLKKRVMAKARAQARRDQAAPPPAAASQAETSAEDRPVEDKIADARAMFLKMRDEFAEVLPKHVPVDRFMRSALMCLRKRPALLECESASLFGALMECARVGLEPGTKQTAIVPRGKKVIFIAQWHGLVDLMYRSGQVSAVHAEFVYAGEPYDYTLGDDAGFWHKPDLLARRGEDAEIILAYAYAVMKDGTRSQLVILNREQVEEIRDEHSRDYQRAERAREEDPALFAEQPDLPRFNSYWHTYFPEMWRKSCVRALANWVPQSPELRYLMARENAAGEIDNLADVIAPGDIFDGEDDENSDAGEPGGQDDLPPVPTATRPDDDLWPQTGPWPADEESGSQAR
ncbi:recombinase RecT [Actinoallomurus sp. NPDC052274]|uniref:recombinase RecT n=1 Tax=Actinoallomurus sp. NPDC052274 TaxID=3155420 RepID=UPI00341BE498